MLFDPAIDVSLLSETELDQLVQSLPSAFGNDDASKIQTALPFTLLQQQGLWAKMAEMFDTGSYSLPSTNNNNTFFPLTTNLHDIALHDHSLSPCSSGESDDHDHDSHSAVASPVASPPRKTSASSASRAGKRAPGKRPKYIRTKSGCLCCRKKRVKCDEEHPSCKRCRNAGRDCVWPAEVAGGGEERGTSGSDGGSSVGDESPEKPTVSLPVGRGSSRSVRGVERGAAKAPSTRPKINSDNATLSPAVSSSQSSYSGNHLSVTSTRSSVSTSPGASASPSFDFNMQFPSLDHEVAISPVSTFNNVAPDMDAAAGFGGVALGPGSLLNPMALLPWFPTAEERGLILHFCQNSSALLMAIPAPLNPVLSVLLPLALSAPRGFSAPTDALRLSLLCVSATHQAYLLARAQAPPLILSKSLDLAIGLRADARVLIKSVGINGGAQGDAADALLAASVMMGVVDVMLGGHSYTQNFELAKALVDARGGPSAIIAEGAVVYLADGVSVSRTRLMLEILAVHEVLSSLVSEKGATLISEGTWWQAENQLSYHSVSVENHFGVTRPVIALLAEATALVTRASLASCVVTERSEDEMSSLLFLEAFGDNHACGSEPDVVGIRRDANELLEKVDALIGGQTLGDGRLRDGNNAYLNAIKILVLRNVFKCARSDTRVQKSALNVLEACSASVAAYRPLHLTWPLIIASSQVDAPARPWVLTVLEGLRTQCCFNVDSGERIIGEVWNRLDQGLEWTDWRSVAEDLDMKILLT
ncbi:fungal-specific transcription factor domain-containing protein [Mrakia frigida]|uniref:Zn(II)2Cys6 transcription factor n=1 Tax=Mrakia frigida TaxID=29902 RepID=UPI003FCC03A8